MLATSLLVGAALLAACGEDDGPPTKTPTTPAKPAGRQPGFEEVAQAAGLDFHMAFLPTEQGEKFKINLYDHGAGVSVGDYDGDGLEDIYLLNQLGPNALFRNQGDGTFTDVTESAGVALGDRICTSASFADYDNDGDQDVFVASTRGGNVLFRNDGEGKFEDVSAAAGVELVAHTQGVVFFDYDSDGDLDLFVTNTAKWTLETREPEGRYFLGPAELFDLVGSEIEENVLYRNNGDGSFADVTKKMGVGGIGWGGDIAVFDADGDGDPDLFVTNMFGSTTLYRNEAGARFTDMTESALGKTSWGAVGCKVLDYDGDGLLDLYVVDMHSDMWMETERSPRTVEAMRQYAGPEGPLHETGQLTERERDELREQVLLDDEGIEKSIFGNTLYRNLGAGRFEEVSGPARAETLWPWSVAAADFDLDGLEDVFVGSGMGYPYMPFGNLLLMNAGDGTFADRAAELGIDPRPDGPYSREWIGTNLPSLSSRSAAVLDFNGDGRPDLVVNNFNERPYLYRNAFAEKRWIALRLRGTRSNRDAIGAVARLEIDGTTQVRQVCAAGGYLAQSTRTLYFGLGDAEGVARCEVVWPNGSRQELTDLAIDGVHDIVEPHEDAR